MPKVSRNGDMCATGHLCTKKAPVRASQFSVFANGKPVLRRGDKVKPHTILVPPLCKVHAANVKGASSKDQPYGIVMRPLGTTRNMELLLKKHSEYYIKFLKLESVQTWKK